MTRTEAAEYLASLAEEMSSIARRNNLPTTAYIFDMASVSAQDEGDLKRDATAAEAVA